MSIVNNNSIKNTLRRTKNNKRLTNIQSSSSLLLSSKIFNKNSNILYDDIVNSLYDDVMATLELYLITDYKFESNKHNRILLYIYSIVKFIFNDKSDDNNNNNNKFTNKNSNNIIITKKLKYIKQFICYLIMSALNIKLSIENLTFNKDKNIYFINYHGIPTNNIKIVNPEVILVILTPLNYLSFNIRVKTQNILSDLQQPNFYTEFLTNPECYKKENLYHYMTNAIIIYPGQPYMDIELSFDEHITGIDNIMGIYSSPKFIVNRNITSTTISKILKNLTSGICFVSCCNSLDYNKSLNTMKQKKIDIMQYRLYYLLKHLNRKVFSAHECVNITTLITPNKFQQMYGDIRKSRAYKPFMFTYPNYLLKKNYSNQNRSLGTTVDLLIRLFTIKLINLLNSYTDYKKSVDTLFQEIHAIIINLNDTGLYLQTINTFLNDIITSNENFDKINSVINLNLFLSYIVYYVCKKSIGYENLTCHKYIRILLLSGLKIDDTMFINILIACRFSHFETYIELIYVYNTTITKIPYTIIKTFFFTQLKEFVFNPLQIFEFDYDTNLSKYDNNSFLNTQNGLRSITYSNKVTSPKYNPDIYNIDIIEQLNVYLSTRRLIIKP